MFKALCKNPLFQIGFWFIILLFAASVIHWLAFNSYIPNKQLLYKHGNLVGASPLTPAQYPLLGTNKQGDSVFFTLLKGAKFTIGIAFVVAALRMFFSIILGVLYGNFLMKVNRYVSKVIDAFHYLPINLLAYVLLSNVLMENGMTEIFQYTWLARAGFEVAILTFIALPTTTLLIGNETNLVLKEEFIEGVKIMGAGRIHIIRKHILPHLIPRFTTQFIQQIIQVLILLAHLGLLKLFFAGTHVAMDLGGITYSSVSGEWSGLIGMNYQYLDLRPWLELAPLGAFACTILAMNLMLEGFKQAQERKGLIKAKRNKTDSKQSGIPANPSFEFLHSGQQMKG